MYYIPFFRIFNVGVNQQTIHLTMYILHGYLKTIKTPGLCHLYLFAKSFHLLESRNNMIKQLSKLISVYSTNEQGCPCMCKKE